MDRLASDPPVAPTGPLHGIRILDFTHGVAGPYASMLLADLGAEVWKVEKPGRGDATRYMNVSERFREDIPGSGGDYFLAINRNKMSVTLDLGKPEGRELALALAEHADVALSNFRPGVMRRLGLAYQDLRDRNPSLVYGSLTAYGQEGPLAHQPGMDVAVQARSGVMAITGHGEGGPVKPGVSLADFAGGAHLCTAVLGALFARERTGHGQEVTISLLDATMSMLANYSVAVLDGQATIGPMGSGHPQLVPFQAFPTADGHVVIATGTNRLFVDLCQVLGTPRLAEDARFRTNQERVRHRAELVALLTSVTVTRSTAHWLERLEANQIPCAPVNDMRQALADPQLAANGMVVEVDHPHYGTLHVLGSPYQFSRSRFPVSRHPPRLGEHTREVLGGVLGLGPDRLDTLAAGGTI